MTPQFCDGISRRGFLRLGSVAGLSLAQFMRLQAAQPGPAQKKDVNCIFIFILGGMPQHDMWDYKPDAPAEIRGDFKAIKTAVPGIGLTDLLPHTAKVTDKLAILRSLTHGDSDHGRGYHIMMTGNTPGPGDFNSTRNNNVHPSLGSMVARMAGSQGTLPPYISVPCFLRSGGPGFLGATYSPFVIEADPAAPEFAVRDVVLPEGVVQARGQLRQDALREINRFERTAEGISRDIRSLDTFYKRAHSLMTSTKAKEAFDLKRDPESLREQYGSTSLGQCCLLARRLVEAGSRFVTIENGHWDTHRENTKSLRDLLVPGFDKALAALVNDLDQRGLLDSTLVVVTTEFGRTPRINTMAGRDHWPNAFSIVMAGGGTRRGVVIGATDKIGASVTDRPITPPDMAATILHALGIDPATTLHTPLGRPVELAGGGKPVLELFGA
ncbi:MAG TPA: DUF1501 domain-containing protein [Gemmataceae bacterium]|jgi:hypothetical protein|nr:DUF1501 domain-containing protein [Gemmataceae bacterium]